MHREMVEWSNFQNEFAVLGHLVNQVTKAGEISFILLSYLFFSFFYSYPIFRAYVASGPSASKTVVHSLVTVLTYLIQFMICHLYFLHILGCVQDIALFLLLNHPGALCLLASPWPYGHAILLYLMYLAFFRLFTVAETNLFLNLDHDLLTSTLNRSSAVYIVIYLLMNFFTGSLCIPRAANILISARMGIQTDIGNLTGTLHNSTGIGSGVPIYLVIITVALLCYVASFIIKKMQVWKQKRAENSGNNGLNIISRSNLNLGTNSTIQGRMTSQPGPPPARAPQLLHVRPAVSTPSLLSCSGTAPAPQSGVLLDVSRLPTSP